MILYTDISYVHPHAGYIYIKGYSLHYILHHMSFEETISKIDVLHEGRGLEIIEAYRDTYEIESIIEDLGAGEYSDKILILNMEDTNGPRFKLNLITQLWDLDDLEYIVTRAVEKISERMDNKIKEANNLLKQIQGRDIDYLVSTGLLKNRKNYHIELSREIFREMTRNLMPEYMSILDIDRSIRISRRLYPQMDIYILPLLSDKIGYSNSIKLLTYSYLPITLAYIIQARRLPQKPSEIVYEGPLGIENLK